jgi:hypothetical protein
VKQHHVADNPIDLIAEADQLAASLEPTGVSPLNTDVWLARDWLTFRLVLAIAHHLFDEQAATTITEIELAGHRWPVREELHRTLRDGEVREH